MCRAVDVREIVVNDLLAGRFHVTERATKSIEQKSVRKEGAKIAVLHNAVNPDGFIEADLIRDQLCHSKRGEIAVFRPAEMIFEGKGRSLVHFAPIVIEGKIFL